MPQPVWVLSVDLQAKTATFATGLGDAAKSARGSFQDIRDSSGEMADGVSASAERVEFSMMEARHSVMFLGEEIGFHIPRALAGFIASLGPVGPALEAAFPFLAIAVGATLLIEHLTKIGEEAEKVAEKGKKFDDDMTLSLNHSKEASIDASIELRNLAGLPAWDLLEEKLKLKDADEGIENVNRLDKALGELIETKAKATSNWNPFNWGDHSDEIKNKKSALDEQLAGKDQAGQLEVLQGNAAIQGKILEQMRGQSDVSKAQLTNQEEYVNWLKQEEEGLQNILDAKVKNDQASQEKDRSNKLDQAAKEAAAWETAYHKRYQDYYVMIGQMHAADEKRVADAEKDAELEAAATAAVNKELKANAEASAKITEDMGKEEARHIVEMGKLSAQAGETQTKEEVKIHKSRSQQILDEQIAGENAQFAAQLSANQVELTNLDKTGKDYEVKLKTLQDKEVELTQAHLQKLQQIQAQADDERIQRMVAAEKRGADEAAQSMSKVLEGRESFAKASITLGNQVAAGLLENALKSIVADDMSKERDAAAAARKAWIAGGSFPWPLNVVMPPTLAAAAFASVMAFEEGGIVPGVERGDVVPARLSPGEAVLPRTLTENLSNAAKTGSSGPQASVHFHHSPTYHVNTIDGDGMRDTLAKHADVVEKHMESAFRRRGM